MARSTHSEQSACEKCGGTGVVSYKTLGDAMPRDIGNGMTVQDMGGSGARPCECVRDLPAIDGEATWWSSESIYSEVVVVPIGNECVEIAATCEIPLNGGGRRLRRTADNAYYPPLVEVQVAQPNMTLHSDTARELAASLIAAADACDKADELAMATRNGGYGGDPE